ncbi:MAG: tRNA (N(6)-L-threonylcarbamoyladenosine(37)-C(2))-methylthiotransferase MtaB [Syntrophaceae bacterium]|nr:tRNA (N(6)-L-threonylcarbamoyladenosine(37)-C(2))-methylthiotransferase MtaB [Syntrophaceae bacterium]
MDRKSSLKVSLITLGCKVNQSDAASLAAEMAARGHQIIPSSQAADVTIVHTCTVTQKTDYQSRQIIRGLSAKNPGGRVIVTGCYAQVAPQILQNIPGVDYVVGTAERKKIPEIIGSRERSGKAGLLVSPVEKQEKFEEWGPPHFAGRTRAFLKVQDGCNSFCSYCIVPFARGRNRSLPPERVLFQARELASRGFKEIVLTGIHLGTYGEDLLPSQSLFTLLQALEGENLGLRLRLSSIEPREITPPLMDYLADSQGVCPHLHIPLQSGDDAILKRMNRNYSASFFADLVNRLAQKIPRAAIGADVIGGFPGEGDSAFRNTMSLIEALPLAYLHVFPFSKRKGTPAAVFPAQVPPQVIRARCQALRELGERKRDRFSRSFLGKRLKVLVEAKRDRGSGLLKGFSENYISVLLPGEDGLMNREVEIEATEVRDGKVFGKVESPR